MEAHPGIVFVKTVTGERRAALAAGPQVWTVAESWRQHPSRHRSPAKVAATLGLIDRHHASQDEALAAWERRRALDAI